MSVDKIIDRVIRAEGSEYTNDPNDSGGPTKYGITLSTLARYRGKTVSAADVSALTEAEARAIYKAKYVEWPGFTPILAISPLVAEEVIDTGVNAGPARATEMLQRCLNALNRQERDYSDVKVDGDCGPATVEALRKYLTLRKSEGAIVLLRALNALQGEFYISLAERRPKDETFLFGWLMNRVRVS